MDCTKTHGRQHSHDGFWYQGHVYQYSISLPNSIMCQSTCKRRHLCVGIKWVTLCVLRRNKLLYCDALNSILVSILFRNTSCFFSIPAWKIPHYLLATSSSYEILLFLRRWRKKYRTLFRKKSMKIRLLRCNPRF